MATIRTTLGTVESARHDRFEPSLNIPATNVQQAIELAGAINSNIPIGVNAAASPYDVPATATLLYVDSSAGPVTINLRAASSRNNLALAVKDIAGSAAANVITIVPNAADTGGIDGLASLPINSNYGGFRLQPGTLRYAIAP